MEFTCGSVWQVPGNEEESLLSGRRCLGQDFLSFVRCYFYDPAPRRLPTIMNKPTLMITSWSSLADNTSKLGSG